MISVCVTAKERLWGFVYMALEFLVLPTVLAAANLYLSSPLSDAWLNLVFFCINLAATGVIFRHFWAQTLKAVQWKRLITSAAAGLGLYFALNLLAGWLLLSLDGDFANVNDASIAAMAQSGFLPLALGTVFLVPAAEESLFRGLVFGPLYNRSKLAAYCVSTAVFALVHILGYLGAYPIETLLLCFLQYVPAGLCLGWAYARADSILCPVLMHTVINAIGIFAMR